MVPVRIFFENSGRESTKVGFAVESVTQRQTSLLLEIRDSSGKMARVGLQFQMSPYGKTMRDFFVTLAPGHFYGWTENLIPYTHAFLKTPGEYEITALYDYVPPNGELHNSTIFSGSLRSTKLKLTIVPSEEKP